MIIIIIIKIIVVIITCKFNVEDKVSSDNGAVHNGGAHSGDAVFVHDSVEYKVVAGATPGGQSLTIQSLEVVQELAVGLDGTSTQDPLEEPRDKDEKTELMAWHL